MEGAKDGDKNDLKLPLPAVKEFNSLKPQEGEGGIKNAFRVAFMMYC
jgi:hypothetical protein